VAGAAHGSFVLVVAGLVISIPIVIWGSTFILHLLERHRWIVHVGVAVLGWTAAAMIVREPLLADFFAGSAFAKLAAYTLIVGGLLVAGVTLARRPLARSS
jgi:predicted tellurium resistance membrane protein TerC